MCELTSRERATSCMKTRLQTVVRCYEPKITRHVGFLAVHGAAKNNWMVHFERFNMHTLTLPQDRCCHSRPESMVIIFNLTYLFICHPLLYLSVTIVLFGVLEQFQGVVPRSV